MKGRMSKEERREQLSQIMLTRYAEARSQGDFKAVSLASEAGVSPVRFYNLVGEQFRKLRAQLPGPILPVDSLINKLRQEVAELHAQVRELKRKYEASLREKFAEAIRHIELLDRENRMLRETVTALEKRLGEHTLVISSSAAAAVVLPTEAEK
jgi:hypothetical protein